ncbi:hypothetical protein OC835_006676 [Tilletia horrida]|nr:hypothetical protein OC835_006676 [Tilletia horrida]
MPSLQPPPAELARAVRNILALSNTPSATDGSSTQVLTSTYAALASLALDEQDTDWSSRFWQELALLAAPSSLALSAALPKASQGCSTAVGFSIALDVSDLSATVAPLQLDWTSASVQIEPSPPGAQPPRPTTLTRNGTLRYWPTDSTFEPGVDSAAGPSEEAKGECLLHFLCQWHSYSIFVSSTARAALGKRIFSQREHTSSAVIRALTGAFAQAHERLSSTGSDMGRWPGAHIAVAFAVRLNALLATANNEETTPDQPGFVLSATPICPLAIATRTWDAAIPSLPSGVTTLEPLSDGLGDFKPDASRNPVASKATSRAKPTSAMPATGRGPIWSRLRRDSGKGSTPADSPSPNGSKVDRNVDCNRDVNNDGAATGPNSAQPASKAALQPPVASDATTSDTTINPNPTSTSTSNAGTGVAVAAGLQSAAAGVATHGPTFSIVQGCSSGNGQSGGTGNSSDASGKSDSANYSHNTFNLGFGISIKLPLGLSRHTSRDRERERERDRAFALQLAAARNAVSSGAVVVAVPGSSASASTSAAAGENAVVDAKSQTSAVPNSGTLPGNLGGDGQRSSASPANATSVSRAAGPKRLQTGKGAVSQSFMDWVPEDDYPEEREGGNTNDEEEREETRSLRLRPEQEPERVRPRTTSETQMTTTSSKGVTTKTTVTTTTRTTIERFPSQAPHMESAKTAREEELINGP